MFDNVFDQINRPMIQKDLTLRSTDQEIEEMKMRRAKLKDYLYHLIRHAPPLCPACEGTGYAR